RQIDDATVARIDGDRQVCARTILCERRARAEWNRHAAHDPASDESVAGVSQRREWGRAGTPGIVASYHHVAGQAGAPAEEGDVDRSVEVNRRPNGWRVLP